MVRFSKGLKCPICKRKMSDKATVCRSCYRESVKREEPPREPRFAWWYNCWEHGIKAFAFDPHKFVRLTCGCEAKRGIRFLYGES